ncbi:MAG: SDR family NAD(P)-dependent oxidoreductase, partial [Opitutaceae bacterium]|nr:SDR family NAD(P)-dependent oxidoreductase [Cytophagales bacterium]
YRGMYCASKAALERYTEALRMEVKKFGIQICLLQPGGIQTDINKNRMVSPMPANSPYKDSFNKCYEIVNASVSKGYPLNTFGPIVKQIVDSKNIKGKYRVSKFTEKLSVMMKRILPASVFEGILMRHFKI